MQAVVTDQGIGIVQGDEVVVLECAWRTLGEVIAQSGSLQALEGCPERARIRLAQARLLPPLGRPGALWGVGLNYRSKAALTGRDEPTDPILFLAAGSSIGDPGGEVAVPAESSQFDYEAELAVVVGTRLHRADPAQVWPAVAGITSVNDMTGRDVMKRTAIPALAKSFPGSKPLGPSVCTLDEFADPAAVRVRSWVNDELRQDDCSSGMIFDIPDLLSRISQYAALEPGDVVITGTPAGTGQDRNDFLVPGDVVRIEIGPVLPLVTTLVPG